MKLNGSEILINCLIENGVDTVFGYPGGAVLFIYDALYKNKDKIRHILTSHEQNAAHAADGYSRSTGKVGVCLSTSGPGATNLITGIATAYMDSIPMIAITGNVGTPLLGKDSFQEIDIFNITMPITKHNYIVRDLKDLPHIVNEAFQIAKSGRPGPVLIDIPKDLTNEVMDYKPLNKYEVKTEVKTKGDINKVIELIENSKKPFIFAGGGVISGDASVELNKFAKLINSPVATSTMGLGAYDEEDELSTGMIGMHGTIASNLGVLNSDLLIAVGTRFSDRVLGNKSRFAPKAKIVHIDIDASELFKNIKPDVPILGNVKTILNTLLSNLKQKDNKDWINQIKKWKKEFTHGFEENTLNPKFLMEEIKRQTNKDIIITTEVGQHQMWAAQYFKYNTPRTLISSLGLGTMGYGTGASIGAQIANPNKRVVHIAGDGSFRMNLTELATIKEYNLPIIVVVVNNKTLGMVRQWQTNFYGQRYSETDLDRGPDFNKLADAYFVKNFVASTQEEFSKYFKEAYNSNEPVLINCFIDKDARVLPMVPAGAGIDDFILE